MLSKVICVTGMPGAGKSIFADVAKKLGLKVINMGDVIREEAEKEGITNLGEVMLKLRRLHGEDIVAKKCLSKITPEDNVVIIEGVRSLAEVEVFRKIANEVVIVAIHASPLKRYQRLVGRGRIDDPKSWEEFVERDLRELSVGIGSVIALADKMFLNEGSVENLELQAKTFFQE
ncbi:MAG: dephospho-CoA kinase, partial [Candidatus Methanomethylicota archaeon]